MSFLLEKNMAPILEHNIQKLLKKVLHSNKNWEAFIGKEVPVQYRVIDMAIVISDENSLNTFENKDFLKPFKYLNSTALDILSLFCVFKEVTISRIVKNLYISPDILKEYLNKLVSLNLIEQISKLKYKATEWINLIPKKMVSIEMKLSNWQEALDQAIFNRKFSEYSFVAIDEDRIPKDKDIVKVFVENDIGLISVNSTGKIHISNLPTLNKTKNCHLSSFQKLKIIKDIVNDNKWEKIQ